MNLKLLHMAMFALAALTLAKPVAAAPPLETYGRLEGFEFAKISPSGKHVALIGVVGEARRLIVLDEKNKLVTSGLIGDRKVRDLDWAGDDTVLLQVSNTAALGIGFTGSKTELTAMLVAPIDGREMWSVFNGIDEITGGIQGYYGLAEREGRRFGYFGGITLDTYRFGVSELMNTNPKLYEVDLSTRKTRPIADRRSRQEDWRDWVVSADGKVATTLDFDAGPGNWRLRNRDLGVIASGVAPTGRVSLISLGRTVDSVFYLSRGDDDVSRYFEQPIKGGEAVELLADESVMKVHVDPYDRTLIGYRRDSDIPEDHFFDPRREKIMTAARKAFPGSTVRWVDASRNFDRLIVQTDGPGDPRSWWLIDIKTGAADLLGMSYPMKSSDVAPMTMLSYKAADGLEMGGVLTLPPGREAKKLPVVILPHGGPGARDYPVFDWWAQAFASRGYAVFQPNFRGSTGSTQKFRAAGRGEWGRKMQTDISDGLAELVRQGIADPKRACIAGHSYGGYAALAGVTLQQGLYRCAISSAGIGDVSKMIRTDVRESGNNATLKRALKEEIGSGRDLAAISPVNFADRADAPILLIHGVDDIVVEYRQSTDMAAALKRAGKPVDLVTLKGEDHWLSKNETRLAMLKAAIAFVEKHNPPDKAP